MNIHGIEIQEDVEFTDDMVEDLGGMIRSLAQFYTDDYTLQQDLMQEGWLGVHQACDKFIQDHGAKFSTYAFHRARAKMQQYIRYKLDVVHIPIAQKDEYIGHMKHIHFHLEGSNSTRWAEDAEIAREIKAALNREDDQAWKDLKQKVRDSVKDLPASSFDLLLSRFYDGNTISGLCEAHGKNRKDIERHIQSALEELRELL